MGGGVGITPPVSAVSKQKHMEFQSTWLKSISVNCAVTAYQEGSGFNPELGSFYVEFTPCLCGFPPVPWTHNQNQNQQSVGLYLEFRCVLSSRLSTGEHRRGCSNPLQANKGTCAARLGRNVRVQDVSHEKHLYINTVCSQVSVFRKNTFTCFDYHDILPLQIISLSASQMECDVLTSYTHIFNTKSACGFNFLTLSILYLSASFTLLQLLWADFYIWDLV